MTIVEKEVILRHAFENAQTLRTALLVGAAYPDICRALVDRQVTAIQNQLEVILRAGDWVFDLDRTGGSFYLKFRKNIWPQSMVIGFGRDTPGDTLYFFAHRWAAPDRAPIDDRLQEALNNGVGASGKATEWSCWWRYLDRFRNWSAIETLEALATSEEPADYVVTFLERIRKVAGPILDAEVNSGAGMNRIG